MDVSDEELRTYSYAQLLEYTLQLRNEIKQDGYVYPYKTSWFNIPLEMREIVIDKMDFKTRCIFSECSTICEREAEKSKKVWAIVFDDREEVLHIRVQLSDKEYDEISSIFTFEKFDENQTTVKYESDLHDREVSTKIVKGNPIQIRSRYANYFFAKFKQSVWHCSVYDFHEVSTIQGIKFGILENVEYLELYFQPENFEHLCETGVIDLEHLRNIRHLEWGLPQRHAYEFALQFKGCYTEIEFSDFDETTIDDFMMRVKNTGIHENSSIVFKLVDRDNGFKINSRRLEPTDFWKETYQGERVTKFIFETNTVESQNILVTYSFHRIRLD